MSAGGGEGVDAMQDWQLVARCVRERRLELGLRQAETPGVSAASWRNLEGARQTSYKPFLLRNVEAALGWPAGTIDELASGARREAPASTVHDPAIGARLDRLEERFERLERAIEALGHRLPQ
jgi:hypothetical protein